MYPPGPWGLKAVRIFYLFSKVKYGWSQLGLSVTPGYGGRTFFQFFLLQL
jgi:hypothetical protein